MQTRHESTADDLWTAFLIAATRDASTPALVLRDAVVTFGELRASAERCAAWLAWSGLEPGNVVAIQLPKRREAYALWLGCLRQGLIYVFVDPAHPAERTNHILQRICPALLVTTTESPNPFGRVLQLKHAEEGLRWLESLPEDMALPSPARLHRFSPAYIMFTSGSTGEPKGAVITHHGVLGLMKWGRGLFEDPAQERFSNVNPLHFDNSVFDLYCGLLNGAAIVPVETAVLSNPLDWIKLLRRGKASVMFAVPTLFLTLDRLKLLTPASLTDVRVFLFGGEGYPIEALRRFHERFRGHARLVNVYGPTETSCICASIEVSTAEVEAAGSGLLPLGRMLDDFDHAVVDDAGVPVPRGDVGELWIGGPCVGLGYYASQGETDRHFCQDPRQDSYRSIWYRSGDRVHESSDGLLWFHGRSDNQVKIRGHRIELEEVDRVVEQVPGIRQAICIVVDVSGTAELQVAFTADTHMNIEELRRLSESWLPTYMQPSRLVQVAAIPTNANGKADRASVRALLRSST